MPSLCTFQVREDLLLPVSPSVRNNFFELHKGHIAVILSLFKIHTDRPDQAYQLNWITKAKVFFDLRITSCVFLYHLTISLWDVYLLVGNFISASLESPI